MRTEAASSTTSTVSVPRRGSTVAMGAAAGSAGVDPEVDDELLDLAGVGFHHPQIGREERGQLNVFADEALEQLLGAGDGRLQVQGLGLEHLLAAERQQLAREGSGALGGLADLLDIVALGIGRAEVFQ